MPCTSLLRAGAAGCCLLAACALRAQVSETTQTVEPGSFLVEMDLVSVSLDREEGLKFTGVAVGSTLLSTGITSDWDVQVGADLFVSQRFEEGELTERRSGVGAIHLRTKWRFWDGGDWDAEAAVIPYARIPTSRAGSGTKSIEGGVILPFKARLPAGFELVANGWVDFSRDEADSGYDATFGASALASREFLKRLRVYAEAMVSTSSGGGAQASAGAGAALALTRILTVDYQILVGLNGKALDRTHALRLNWLF